MARHWTNKERNKLVELWEEGKSNSECAQALRRTKDSIRSELFTLRNHGRLDDRRRVNFNTPKIVPTKEESKEWIRAMRNIGCVWLTDTY